MLLIRSQKTLICSAHIYNLKMTYVLNMLTIITHSRSHPPKCNPQSQYFFQSCRSNLPTSLAYIHPSTRGRQLRMHAADMDTDREKNTLFMHNQHFKGRHLHTKTLHVEQIPCILWSSYYRQPTFLSKPCLREKSGNSS